MSGSVTVFYISINGAPPSPEPVLNLDISPGWLNAMKIPLIDGRGFRPNEAFPKVAIVNRAFANRYFAGQNSVGKTFGTDVETRGIEIVGLVGDARYTDMRGSMPPTAYVPFRYLDEKGALRPRASATLIVRTSGANPLALASALRREVPRTRPGFRVSNMRTQRELVESQTLRERLLATLAVFFAATALLLAGIGLYGVLEYSVHQRRREIGIRIAIGARPIDIARRVTLSVFSMVTAGACVGVALGTTSARYVETLLYAVKATDPPMVAIPSFTIATLALLAALPPVIHAVRVDPAEVLRCE
jgi:hypothetical protein